MPVYKKDLRSASVAACIHLLISIAVAAVAAVLMFGVWYPYPYRELAGGRELFLLVVVIDVVCGPLLTFVIFNPKKPRAELIRDLTFVAVIQSIALVYGMYSVWLARPLFLVQEIDRFKLITAPQLDSNSLGHLTESLAPRLIQGPKVVAIRPPKNNVEREKVMREAALGGRDYAERPEFYLAYEGANALKSLSRAKPLAIFLQKQPDQNIAAQKLAAERKVDISQWMYLPVVARQDWVAVLDKQGQIQGFLKGDGF